LESLLVIVEITQDICQDKGKIFIKLEAPS